MIQAFVGGLAHVLSWPAFPLMLLGMSIGFLVGILPGLGGSTALALLIPFVYTMDPVTAFAFLLGMHSVVNTTGDVTSILFGVPGEPSAAAVIADGHALTKLGQAGRALGAALLSSSIGAVCGALILLLAIPVLVPASLAIGSPEFLMLALLGISFIAALSTGGSLMRGLIVGGVGLLVSAVGSDPYTATHRYVFDQPYLWRGVPLVPLVVGLFGIPELLEMAVKRNAGPAAAFGPVGGIWDGVRDTLRYWHLSLRTCILGVVIGIIPGMGGQVASWLSYAHAVQTSRDRSRFGKGAIEGVIAPAGATHSKEGGELIPTIAFGVPASASMAILLGAFLVLGLKPGPDMLTTHIDVTFSMIWTIIVANLIAVGVCLFLLQPLAKLAQLRNSLLIPFILFLVYLGAYTASNSLADLITMLCFGVFGSLMMLFNWPRPPLVLGVVLGDIFERNLFISTTRYGLDWLARPGVIAFMILIALGLVYGARRPNPRVQAA